MIVETIASSFSWLFSPEARVGRPQEGCLSFRASGDSSQKLLHGDVEVCPRRHRQFRSSHTANRKYESFTLELLFGNVEVCLPAPTPLLVPPPTDEPESGAGVTGYQGDIYETCGRGNATSHLTAALLPQSSLAPHSCASARRSDSCLSTLHAASMKHGEPPIHALPPAHAMAQWRGDGVGAGLQRWLRVKVEAQDGDGRHFTRSFRGFAARVFQHEYDHLQACPPPLPHPPCPAPFTRSVHLASVCHPHHCLYISPLCPPPRAGPLLRSSAAVQCSWGAENVRYANQN